MSENKNIGEQKDQSASTSKTFPLLPAKQTEEIPEITIFSDSWSSRAKEVPFTANIDTELTVTAEIKYSNGNETEQTEMPLDNQTPAISSPVSCSTELIQRRIAKNTDTTPTGSPQKDTTSVNKGIVDFSNEGGKLQIL